MVCGSLSNASKMEDAKKQLEANGHEAVATQDLGLFIANPDRADDLDADLKHCIENDMLREFMDLVASSNALLVLNYPKNGTDGYIGTSVIIELGLGYYLRKKLFILNPLPDYHKVRWAHEVAMMNPICINADLTKIR